MKKLYLIGILVLFCSLAFNNQVKASIDIDMHVSITELNNGNCHPTNYTGYYHITVEFMTNDDVECAHDVYTTSTNPEITWTCEVTFDQFKDHSFRVTVCHWDALNGDYCCGNGGRGNLFMTQCTDGSITVNVTVN